MRRAGMVAAILCLAAIEMASKPYQAPAHKNHSPQQKEPNTIFPLADSKSTSAPPHETNNNPPYWYAAIKQPEWWLVAAAFLTIGVVGWQSIKTAQAAKAASDSVDAVNRQAGIMERQTAAMEKAADAALLNVQAVVNSERALVEVDLTEPTDIDEETEESAIDYAKEFQYGVRIVNHGRTVARITSFKIWHDCFARNFSREGFSNSFERTRHIILGTDKPITIGNIDLAELFKDWDSMHAKTKTGMLRIDIRYEDVVQGRPHETSAVFRYSLEEEVPIRMPQYNEYT